jgi:hypothetical protein
MLKIGILTLAAIAVSHGSSIAANSSALPAKLPMQVGTPPNTIHCEDWTHNADGTWTAHKDAKPFGLGTVHETTVRDSTVYPRFAKIGGYDLATALDQVCGAKH